jgi:cytochrome bd-type quinol oxidase subunit 1
LFGTGPRQFQALSGVDNVIHAAWLRLGVEIGLVALVLMSITAYLATRQVIRTAVNERSWVAVAVLAGMIAVAIEASFQGSFGRPTWVVLALGLSAPWR